MNLQPLGDRVVVQAIEAEQVTASGIVLPDTATEKPQRGKVVAVGEGRYEDGQRVPVAVTRKVTGLPLLWNPETDSRKR